MGKTFAELRLPRRREYHDDEGWSDDREFSEESEADEAVSDDDDSEDERYGCLLDEIRGENRGTALEDKRRRWARYAISVALEEIPRKFRSFDTGFVKSLEKQLRSRRRFSDKQLDSLNRIVRRFRVEPIVREQYTTRRRVIRR